MRKVAVIIAAVALQVATVAGPAAAVKPVRGCAPPFTRMSRAALRATVPQVPEDAFNQIFNAIDKNRDDQVCVKQQPTFTNAVDNTSNAR